jgi:hypothetical protein
VLLLLLLLTKARTTGNINAKARAGGVHEQETKNQH